MVCRTKMADDETNHDVEEAPVAVSRSMRSHERSSSASSQDESEDCGTKFKESLPCGTCQSDKTEVPQNGGVVCLSCQRISELQTRELDQNKMDDETPMAVSRSSQERPSSTSLQDESEDCGTDFKESLLGGTCQSNKTKVLQNGAVVDLYCQSVSELKTFELDHEMASLSNEGELLSVAGLPSLPDGSLEDSLPVEESFFAVNGTEDPSSVSTFEAAVGPQNVKIPVEGVCDFGKSIESPCRRTTIAIFMLRQQQFNRSVARYSVYCVPSHMAKQRISERGRGEELCAFNDERAGSLGPEYFIYMSISNHVTVSFQMTNACYGKFARYPDQVLEQVISLQSILSEAHNRIGPPGARANLFLECTGSLHELHQAHIKVAIRSGEEQRNLAFPIWGFGPAYPD